MYAVTGLSLSAAGNCTRCRLFAQVACRSEMRQLHSQILVRLWGPVLKTAFIDNSEKLPVAIVTQLYYQDARHQLLPAAGKFCSSGNLNSCHPGTSATLKNSWP